MARKWILPLFLLLGVLISGCSEGQEKGSKDVPFILLKPLVGCLKELSKEIFNGIHTDFTITFFTTKNLIGSFL